MAGKSSGSFSGGFIIGMCAGLAVGFLYAPSTGKELRERLRQKAGEIKEMASDRIEQTRAAAAEAGRKVRERLTDQ